MSSPGEDVFVQCISESGDYLLSVLAEHDASCKGVMTRTSECWKVSLRDESVARIVVAAVLRLQYNIKWSLPERNLCPPVPNRLAYVRWILSLLALEQTDKPTTGLDIGTGASIIYPLLAIGEGVATMYGTDTDDLSLKHAASIIDANERLKGKVFLLRAEEGVLIPAVRGVAKRLGRGEGVLSFTVCNPPFFEEGGGGGGGGGCPATKRRKGNQGVCTLTTSENEVEGGELAFVSRLLSESLQLGPHVVTWYSTMFGRKVSLRAFRKILETLRGTVDFRCTEFTRGTTTRWLVAWKVLKMEKNGTPLDLLTDATEVEGKEEDEESEDRTPDFSEGYESD